MSVFIIAEACDNHFGSLSRAIEMVKKAKSSGANCIKFQHHLPDALFSKGSSSAHLKMRLPASH